MIFKNIRDPAIGDLLPSRVAFEHLERVMKFAGWISPLKGTRFYWLYRAWSVLVTTLSGIYVPVGFFASYIINFSSFTPGDFLTSIQVAFNAACLFVKIVILIPNVWRFQKAKDQLDIMDKRFVLEGEAIEIHRCVVRCNSVYMVYQTIYASYSLLTYFSSVLTGSTPWGIYIPFVDYRSSTHSLWLAATFELIVGSGSVLLDLLVDIYPVIFGILLRTHIQLLMKRVARLRESTSKTEDETYEELVNCVKDHKNILQYSDILRPVISGTIFAQFLAIGLCLGLSMANLLFFSNIWTGLATFVFIFVLMIQTFPFCFICELVEDDCIGLTNAIFHSNWIGASKRYKTTLIYFLQQTQRTITFIAGGIFPICMKTNIEMAKLAFTVVTVVKQMNFIEKLK
ncbi:odorant receptor 42b [Drosophila virilis]|uniref:odorant receptor 42b n=1 Tax=Drosophila virilis TaxID=7244 RepID=UPI00017D3111